MPLLIRVFGAIERARRDSRGWLLAIDWLQYQGDGPLGNFRDSARIPLDKPLLSLSTGDNTASLWLQSLAARRQTHSPPLDP